MRERSLSLSLELLIAYLLFVVGLAMIGLNFRLSATNDHLGFASVPVIALAMLLIIRSYFCRMANLVKDTQALLQDAYSIGREVGREESEGGVRSLR